MIWFLIPLSAEEHCRVRAAKPFHSSFPGVFVVTNQIFHFWLASRVGMTTWDKVAYEKCMQSSNQEVKEPHQWKPNLCGWKRWPDRRKHKREFQKRQLLYPRERKKQKAFLRSDVCTPVISYYSQCVTGSQIGVSLLDRRSSVTPQGLYVDGRDLRGKPAGYFSPQCSDWFLTTTSQLLLLCFLLGSETQRSD